MFPRLPDLSRWDDAKGVRPICRLMVASNEVSAVVAFPEWQIAKVTTMRINFSSVSKPCFHISTASAAIDFSVDVGHFRPHIFLITQKQAAKPQNTITPIKIPKPISISARKYPAA